MPDPKIEEAKKWCEEARKLLNWASLPGTERWNMGTNINAVGEALDKLELAAKSPALVGRYKTCVTEYENLGKRAKAANASQDDVAIKVISGELAILAGRIKEVENAVVKEKEEARKKFDAAKKDAESQLKALEGQNGKNYITTELGTLQATINAAQADFNKADYVDAMGRFPTFHADLLAAKRTRGAEFQREAAEDPVAALKSHAAFTGTNGVANTADLRPLIDAIEGKVSKARDELAAERFNPALKIAADVYFEAKRLTAVAARHAAYATERIKVEGLIAALPTDHAAINKAIADKAIGDYNAELAAAKLKGAKNSYDAAATLLTKATADCGAAKKIKEDEAAWALILAAAEHLVDGLPKDNPSIKNDVIALGKRLTLAKEKAAVRDYAGAKALAEEVTATHAILDKLTKDDAAFGVKSGEAAGQDDTAAAVEALRALWQQLSSRTPADVPKIIKAELDQIDTKLKTVSAELTKPKETTAV